MSISAVLNCLIAFELPARLIAPITKSRRFQDQRKSEIYKQIHRSVNIFHDLPIHQLWMILNQFSKSGVVALFATGEAETSGKG